MYRSHLSRDISLTFRASLERLPFPDNYFDFVRGVRVTFHVPEDMVRNINHAHISYPNVALY